MASITINWIPSILNSINQEVQYKQASSSTWATHSIVSPSDTNAVITGLNNNVLYDVRILNNCTYGVVISSKDSVIAMTCPTLSVTPGENSMVYSFSGTITGVTSYTVQLLNSSNVILQTQNKSASTFISGTFSGLTGSTSYKLKLIVVSPVGNKICPPINFSTTVPIIPCGSSTAYSGGEAFPSENIITLGNGTGTVTLSFDAISVPDKFIVIYDGVEVINTGYRGDSAQQSELDIALAARGLPSETIISGGAGTLNFNKSTTTGTAIVRVYAPISGTAWNYNLSCPANLTYTYVKTSDFQKNNCAGFGETGSIVTFSKTYNSSISLADAQAQAAADDSVFDTQGQANANTNGICNPPLPSDAVGIAVIDIYGNPGLDACCYIDTPGATLAYQHPVYKMGNNFYPNDGTAPENCWLLASDLVTSDPLDYRFEVNIARLINTYPLETEFVIKIKGRSTSQSLAGGLYALKGADVGNMTMQGSPGSYIPSTAATSNLTTEDLPDNAVQAGANGSIGINIGSDIYTFVYNVAAKTLTVS